ncbi:MAG: CHASE domain-containing protein [Hoeflea sp.]|uniref:CHASE domain-containing protein n=1 Tax=Hoeflea sp. TaxID=1940281 RepID=UPI0027305660|nr:CHASE domain-containing protein [Hoeflea sp.]MDP2121873.1 CHASE domain-containing protein [Hoeflea sp.]
MLYRVQPILIFAVVSLVGLLTAAASWYTIDHANKMSFSATAENAVQRLSDRIESHILLVKSTEALFEATGEVPSAEAFKIFVRHLQRSEQFSGVQGIGFARYLPAGAQSDATIARELERNYGIARAPWPETSEEMRTPIVLMEPQTSRSLAALGYDMYSSPVRRAAILAAVTEERLRATGRVQLVSETSSDPQAGFVMYTPFVAAESGLPVGFVFAPFRIGDLFKSALNRLPVLPVHITAWDGEPADTSLIFRSDGDPGSGFGVAQKVRTSLTVAGRIWTLEIQPSEIYSPPVDQTRSFMLMVAAVFLAAALAASSHSQQRTIEVGEILREETERALTERELLLQEMKHRIKNMIARVLAISRQTARASEGLPEFTQSFSARLQAMAASQDLLARTAWQGADLETLLVQELKQLFGDDPIDDKFAGPKVELNESAAQAFGLAFHELATNALKYGSARFPGGVLDIAWTVTWSRGNKADLVLTWSERSEEPLVAQGAEAPLSKGGFGTKLLDATIRGEMGGSITSVKTEYGINVTISVPYERVTSRPKTPRSARK